MCMRACVCVYLHKYSLLFNCLQDRRVENNKLKTEHQKGYGSEYSGGLSILWTSHEEDVCEGQELNMKSRGHVKS